MQIPLRSRSWLAAALIALVAAAMPAAFAQALAQPSDDEVKARVDAYMRAAIEFEKFSGAILIARDGRPIVSRGYGWANAELEVPNTPNTVFRLASVSKQFTAVAILLLQERGKLKTSDRLCQHLADCPQAWQSITLRQLLTMTAGVPGVSAAELGPLRGLPVPWSQWLEAMRKKPLDFKPGEDFKYSNGGYTLLGFVIEQVSGMAYGEFLAANLFSPLAMTQTALEDPTRIVRHRATGYRQLSGELLANVPYAEVIRLYAAGGVYSTTEDLLRWDQALQAGKVLSPESMAEMFTHEREMYPGKRYAYGVWTSEKFGRLEVAHGGNLAGFITYFARFPADRATVIVLSNNGRGSSGKISHQLSAILFGAPHETPKERKAVSMPAEQLQAFVGEYSARFPPTDYSMTLEDGKLMVLESGLAKAEVHAEAPNDFFMKTADIQFKFIRNARGEVTGFVAHQGDSTLYETVEARRKSR
jgi:CubicO group peptidase (beta-lactamase class C family)